MNAKTALLRLTLASVLAVQPIAVNVASADTPDVTFELRPHCEQPVGDPSDPCPEYAVRDPLSRQTSALQIGDTLDMDLILHNPSAHPLERFRAWIGYDSSVLEGITVEIHDVFPVATPGEDDFSLADNYVKLSGSSDQPRTDTMIVLARITMKVIATPSVGTVLSFYDPQGGDSAHTGAFMLDGGVEENVVSITQGSLAVRLGTASSASSASVPAASSASSEGSVGSAASSVVTAPISSAAVSSAASSVLPVAPTVFTQLQVQALRVTTDGSSAFLAWNPLPSAELAGYNVYYGTISGRYLQRRSVNREAQTITIRALPVGQVYYFAVRAVNVDGQESDFSQEVAVTIGNPATSTSPLSGALIEGGPNGNAPHTDGSISGESGPATWMLLFAGASAVMGTLLAVRRQWTASTLVR